jgi:hypothetical protein
MKIRNETKKEENIPLNAKPKSLKTSCRRFLGEIVVVNASHRSLARLN